MEEQTQTALQITEWLLALTGDAMMADDFEAFHRHQILPQPIETFEGRKMVTTPAQMQSVFESVRAHQKRLGVTRLERRCAEAKFVGRENLEAVYTSFAYRDRTLIQQPYQSFAFLRLVNDEWKFAYCMYGVPGESRLNDALLNVPQAQSSLASA